MKLYTEEQVNFAMRYATVTKESYSEVLKQLIPIELPSDEEVKDKSFNKFAQSNARTCFEEGAKWIKEQILQPNL
jgi:hypothetical protein